MCRHSVPFSTSTSEDGGLNPAIHARRPDHSRNYDGYSEYNPRTGILTTRLPIILNLNPTPRLRSSSFFGVPYRILNINHKKELPWRLWVNHARYSMVGIDGIPVTKLSQAQFIYGPWNYKFSRIRIPRTWEQ